MKDYLKIAAVVALCVLLACFIRGGCGSPQSGSVATQTEVKSDTTYIHDTIFIPTPTLAGSQQLGFISATLPIYRHPQFGSDHTESQQTAESTDTDHEVELQRSEPPDSANVEIPIEQKQYTGENYDAWVSGYQPQLDSLRIYADTKTISTTTEITRWKTKRWGLSIGVGIVATPTRVEPGIFIGATYTFFAF